MANAGASGVSPVHRRLEGMNCVLVGTGFGAVHSAWLGAIPGVRVGAIIYNSDCARAKRLQTEHGVAEVGTDLREALSRSLYDLVVIVSPPSTHVAHLRAAVEAGVPVVLDKPVADGPAAAQEIARLSRATSGQNFTFFQWRLHPVALRLRELCASEIGDLSHASTGFEHDFLALNATNWPWRHSIQAAGGGSLGDMGVHLFDLLRAVTRREWRVVSAQSGVAYPERHGPEGPVPCDADDFADVHLAAAGGTTARVTTSRVAYGSRRIWMRLYGRSGLASAAIDPEAGTATLSWTSAGRGPVDEHFGPSEGFNPYVPIVARLRGEDTGNAVPATVEDGLVVQSLMSAAVAAAAPST